MVLKQCGGLNSLLVRWVCNSSCFDEKLVSHRALIACRAILVQAYLLGGPLLLFRVLFYSSPSFHTWWVVFLIVLANDLFLSWTVWSIRTFFTQFLYCIWRGQRFDVSCAVNPSQPELNINNMKWVVAGGAKLLNEVQVPCRCKTFHVFESTTQSKLA